jgi:RNA recognition motif-containing protein
MNIYVGNLAFGTREESLKQLFEQFGGVSSARIIMDKMTGKSRGFAFVEMDNDAEAQQAIESLNGTELDGRALRVTKAEAKTDRPYPLIRSTWWRQRRQTLLIEYNFDFKFSRNRSPKSFDSFFL